MRPEGVQNEQSQAPYAVNCLNKNTLGTLEEESGDKVERWIDYNKNKGSNE